MLALSEVEQQGAGAERGGRAEAACMRQLHDWSEGAAMIDGAVLSCPDGLRPRLSAQIRSSLLIRQWKNCV